LPRFTVVVNDIGALRAALLPPSLIKICEAFIRGDVEIGGDLGVAIERLLVFVSAPHLVRRSVALLPVVWRLPRSARPARPAAAGLRLRGRRHSRARDRAAVQHHYDISNDLYALFLDRLMVYSCAYYETGKEDLECAQESKLALICRKLELRPGQRLLDIGAGWGALAVYAAERHGVQVLGITLSKAQASFAHQRVQEAGLSSRAEIVLRDYRDLSEEEAFDRISSIEMFEHVGREQLGEYFARVYRMLKPGGLFLNQGNSVQERVNLPFFGLRWIINHRPVMDRYILPDQELVSISRALDAAEGAGFEVVSVQGLREHHARTMHTWLGRLEAREADATRLVGAEAYRVCRLLLAGCAKYYEVGMLGVYQMLLRRPSTLGQSSQGGKRES
jgi:cyclopropane-fatty-acyl-phospholipid synthase